MGDAPPPVPLANKGKSVSLFSEVKVMREKNILHTTWHMRTTTNISGHTYSIILVRSSLVATDGCLCRKK